MSFPDPQLDADVTFHDKDIFNTTWTGICVGFDGDKVKLKIPLWGPHGYDDAAIDREQIIDVVLWPGPGKRDL